MNRVLIAPVKEVSSIPDFGDMFQAHINGKRNPQVRTESIAAWKYLSEMLQIDPLPIVEFEFNGKPFFKDQSVYFSLAHSSGLTAVVLSDCPCGIDIEMIRNDISERLYDRCLLPSERGMDFFEAWTFKEAYGKMTGEGIRPLLIDSCAYPELNRVSFEMDFKGARYRLCALSKSGSDFEIEHRK